MLPGLALSSISMATANSHARSVAEALIHNKLYTSQTHTPDVRVAYRLMRVNGVPVMKYDGNIIVHPVPLELLQTTGLAIKQLLSVLTGTVWDITPNNSGLPYRRIIFCLTARENRYVWDTRARLLIPKDEIDMVTMLRKITL